MNAEVKPEHEWFYNSSKCAPQQALRDLDNAWKRYLKIKGSGVPKRKKKFVNDHFYLDGTIVIKDGFIQLPRIGLVRLHEAVPNQKIKSVTISRKATEWYVAFKIEVEQVITNKGFGRVGVDLGIKTLATLSNGTINSQELSLTPAAQRDVVALLNAALGLQVGGAVEFMNHAQGVSAESGIFYNPVRLGRSWNS